MSQIGPLAYFQAPQPAVGRKGELRAQKLDAVGRLAASIAHDFNNVLQIVLGSVHLLLLRLMDRPAERASIERLSKQVERGARITRQLLVFAREQPSDSSHFDLREPVESITSMLRVLLREDLIIDLKLPAEGISVAADPVHIEQIVTNLAINAADAMPQGGSLTIALERRGDEAVISVIDSGIGIPEKLHDQLFEPFFTTKDASRGTGLGLAIVRQLARQHGGDVTLVRTAVDRGTEFAVTLPITTVVPSLDGSASALPTVRRGAGELILLVEDDPGTRASLGELLTEIGYRVRPAATCAEARHALAKAPADLVLTDVVLPDGRGESLLEEISQLDPPPPVVFLSGYSASETLAQRVADHSAQYLRKPVGVAELAETIARALGATPSDTPTWKPS